MPAQLVRGAIEQSRIRDPFVNTMALLTGARVLAYMDLPAARQALAKGITAFEQLSLDVHTAQIMRHDMMLMAVPVEPERAISMYRQSVRTERFPFDGRDLVGALAAHGFSALALDLLEDLRYPVEGASLLIHAGQDKAFQLPILRAAKARWRLPRHSRFPDEFHRLFSRNFRLLDAAEASAWLDELLLRAKTLPADRITARFGDKVYLETFADMQIFELLNALRVLKPVAFVEAVLRQYPAVAAAAKDFPNGTESIFPEAQKTRPAASCPTFPFNPTQSTTRLLEEAHHIFIEDVNTNTAPRALWPSAHAYRLALYWAGQREGKDGSKHLQSIPDADLAILATIELAGGILDLPMRQGFQRRSPHRNV